VSFDESFIQEQIKCKRKVELGDTAFNHAPKHKGTSLFSSFYPA